MAKDKARKILTFDLVIGLIEGIGSKSVSWTNLVIVWLGIL